MSEFLPIKPSPSEPSDATASRPTKRKRENTRQACQPCRISKAKCDGKRPTCSPCNNKTRECVYEFGGPANIPRQTAMKARLESLENLLLQLRIGSESNAKDLFEKLRSNVNMQTLLADLDSGDVSGADVKAENVELSPPTQFPQIEAQEHSNCIDVQHSLTSLASPRARERLIDEGPISLRDAPLREPLVQLAWQVEIPGKTTTKAAIKNFFDCAGQLLHVFTKEQAEVFYDDVFNGPSQTPGWKASACCLCAIAAIGKVYDSSHADSGSARVYYDVAKSFFEELLEVRSLEAIKVCTLLALYNIFDKATLALVHIEVGMSLSRYYGLETNRRLVSMPRDQWIDCRKAWRTLLFFKSWLCFTLGYMAGDDILAGETVKFEDLEITNGDTKEDLIQTETAKISLLKAKILRMDLAFKEISAGTTRAIWNELEQWHHQLPKEMSLEMLAQGGLEPDYTRSIYYIHLLYQGAGMLLYRRIVSQHAHRYNEREGEYPPILDQRFLEALLDGRRMADITAQMLKILMDTHGIFKRCWLVIFQAFTAGTLILYEASQKQIHNFPKEYWIDDLKEAESPLSTLKFCAELDPVAHKFHAILLAYHESICSYERPDPEEFDMVQQRKATDPMTAQYLCQIPTHGDQLLVEQSLSLRQLLCRPFGDPQRKQSSALNPRRIEIEHLDWHLGSSVPFHWDAQQVVGGDSTLLSPLNERPNVFLGSSQPLGWEPVPAGTRVPQ